MTAPSLRHALLWLLVIPAVLCVGFNLYMVHSIRSNLRLTSSGVVSDLYPSWRGTHDLLFDGVDPYTDSQTREYQRGYYGRIPDDADIGGGVGYQGFVYPLFLCVVLAPLAILPFGIVQWLAVVAMFLAIAWTSKSWMRLTGWPERQGEQWLAGLLWAGSAPSLYLVGLQQLTGLVVALLGLATVAVARRRFGWAGVFMAIGLFKPQLTLIVLAGVAVWAWRERALTRFVRGFVVTGLILLLSSLALQPDWPSGFLDQARTYAATNDLWGMLSIFPAGIPHTGATVAIVLVSLGAGLLPWLFDSKHDARFTDGVALLIAATLMVNPGVLVYNAVLLIFPLGVLLRRCAAHDRLSVRLPTSAGLALLGISFASGLIGAGLVVAGQTGAAGVVIELMGLGFMAASLPLWIALLALHLTSQAEGSVVSLPRRIVTRSEP